MALRAVLYRRISTNEDQQRYSLEAQKTLLLEKATREGFEVVADFVDQDSGGKVDRPGLEALRQAMAKCMFDIILVTDLDRLSRLDELDFALLKREIREAGVRVIPLSGPTLDMDDASSELVATIVGGVGRFERRLIIARTVRACQEAACRGVWLGSPPLGFRRQDGRLVPDPETVPIVQHIFRRYVEGAGFEVIAKELNRMGIRGARGGVWKVSKVRAIIRNPAYAGRGVIQVGGREIEVELPPIIPKELFAKAQEILAVRSGEYRRWHTAGRTLLAGLTYCGVCGERLGVESCSKEGRHYAYFCHSRQQTTCGARFSAAKVEARVLEFLRDVAARPEVAAQILAQDEGETEREKAALKAELRRVEEGLQKLEAKARRLTDLYLEAEIGKDEFKRRKGEIEGQQQLLDKRRKELRTSIEALDRPKIDPELLRDYFQFVAAGMKLPRQKLREVLQTILIRVIIGVNDIRVEAKVPFMPDSPSSLLGSEPGRDCVMVYSKSECLPGF